MTIEPIVKEILKTNKATREDDNLLFIEVVYRLKPELVNKNFGYVFNHSAELGLPNFKSVERARRKLQKNYEELASSKRMQAIRKEEEKKYIEYSKKK